MILINVLIGILLLLLGRQLFWLFVGGIGFLVGLAFATQNLHLQSDWMALAIALMVGIIGALLAVFLEAFAIGLAGFLGGGYTVVYILQLLGIQIQPIYWIVFIIGGIAGLILVLVLLNWALISISSLAGAGLIVQNFRMEQTASLLFFVILFFIGVIVQGLQLHRQEKRK